MTFDVAKKLALDGHNLIVTGQCGTGKTHLMRCIIEDIQSTKVVAITASTGMASVGLGHGAMTLHHWAGLGDGRFDAVELEQLILNDERYIDSKARIQSAQTLMIDEIGMLSMKLFDTLEHVCRKIRGNDSIFGGLQVLRQGEADLIKAVHELCDGNPSTETEEMLQGLDKPLAGNPVRLYGTNFDVEFVNYEKLNEFPGDLHSLPSRDTGNSKLLRRSPVNKVLGLKVGAPVVLLRNLSRILVNGMKGTVYGFSESMIPTFNFGGHILALSRERFEILDRRTGKVLACRTQLPVKLAFALTTHRAQGQTLPSVEVDCQSFFAAGQMGVAIGRAVSKEGLRVVNYNPTAARIKHPDSVYQFYETESIPPVGDLSCCKSAYSNTSHDIPASTMSLSKASELPPTTESSVTLDTETLEQCPFDFNEFLEKEARSRYLTNMSKDVLESDRLVMHINHLYTVVTKLYQNPKKTTEFSQFYTQLNTFLLSNTHINLCHGLFESTTLTSAQNRFSTKLTLWLAHKIIEEAAAGVLAKQTAEQVVETVDSSNVGIAKIRYVAGETIFRLQDRLRTSVITQLGRAASNKSKLAAKLDYKKQQLIKTLRISEDEALQEGTGMSEIVHKQQQSHGLFVVSKEVLDFFLALNEKLSVILSPQHIHLAIDTLHDSCRVVQNDDTLLSSWCDLFSSTSESGDDDEPELIMSLVIDMFMAATEHFIRISITDSIKQFKETLPKTKKQALRAKVQALGDRSTPSSSKKPVEPVPTSDEYICPICDSECKDEFDDPQENSIACDFCNNWFHYKCCGVKGTESFVSKKRASWKCTTCKASSKKSASGRGKKSRRT